MQPKMTSDLPSCPNKRHQSKNYSVIRKGERKLASGTHSRYLCRNKFGESHSFSGQVQSQAQPKIKVTPQVSCPDHKGSRVHSRGTAKTKAGVWAQYQCRRADGEKHYFRILKSSDGSGRAPATKPPECPEHPKSKVVRNGTKGAGLTKRQSYRCEPDSDQQVHFFSPPLTREAVGISTSCSTCDEILSPHRGPLTAARHTPWTLVGVVQALNNLALGASYSSVSLFLRDQRRAVEDHLLVAHGVELITRGDQGQQISSSWARQQGRNAWQLAANLVEQYSPLLFNEVKATIERRERKLRDQNDALLLENPHASLRYPIVYILDELPVEFHQWKSNRNRLQQNGWSLLVVVEIVWRRGSDPLTLPQREPRLRLARAYPRGGEEAWRLVLNELPVRPDFVVADADSGIQNAVKNHYAQNPVELIPSLYHVKANIRDVLLHLPNASTKVQGRLTLIPELEEIMDLITRDDLTMKTLEDLSEWWDLLIAKVVELGSEPAKVMRQRISNEPRLAEAIRILRKHPQLPGSNAAVESQIKYYLEPFLENRKQRYRNLARTNLLMDLAVCRSQGTFSNLNKIGKVIREANESAGGWAPAPRKITDLQPAGAPRYSSLLNGQLLSALSIARGIAPAFPTQMQSGQTTQPRISSAKLRLSKRSKLKKNP